MLQTLLSEGSLLCTPNGLTTLLDGATPGFPWQKPCESDNQAAEGSCLDCTTKIRTVLLCPQSRHHPLYERKEKQD